MAQERKYLERTLPSADVKDGESTVGLIAKGGLSKKSLIDSEYFKDCLNIDVGKIPVICPMKIYAEAEDVSRMWKVNEGKSGDELLGQIPIGEFPSVTAFGKYIAVGSYISPRDILNGTQAWKNWFNATINEDENVDIMGDDGEETDNGNVIVIAPDDGEIDEDVIIGEEL